jgi:hypothetical protein
LPKELPEEFKAVRAALAAKESLLSPRKSLRNSFEFAATGLSRF